MVLVFDRAHFVLNALLCTLMCFVPKLFREYFRIPFIIFSPVWPLSATLSCLRQCARGSLNQWSSCCLYKSPSFWWSPPSHISLLVIITCRQSSNLVPLAWQLFICPPEPSISPCRVQHEVVCAGHGPAGRLGWGYHGGTHQGERWEGEFIT